MKKRIAMFLAFMMMIMSISSVSVTVSAEPLQQVTFTGSNVSINVSEVQNNPVVEVTVTMSEVTNLGALELDLIYDPAKLELVSANQGAGLTGGFSDVFPPSDGKISLAYINGSGFNGSGVILTAAFTIKESAAGTIPLVIDVVELAKTDFSAIPNQAVNGSIAVYANLEGTVNITGTPKYGEQLTANITDKDPAEATTSYQWNRNGSAIVGATNSTYTVTQADIGKVITVIVTGTGYYLGSLTSNAVTPTKADSAQANQPVATEISWNRVVLQETAGYEYKLNNSVWQQSPIFENLNPNTEYTFYQRVAETDTHFAGEISEGLTVTTEKGTVAGTVNITGTLQYGEVLTANTNDITPAGATISYQWSRNDSAIDGATNSTYTVTQADIGQDITVTVTGTGDYMGVVTSAAVVPTKADSAQAGKPVATIVGWNQVVLEETAGYEYQMNDGEWQQSGTFENLDPNTEYTFYQRIAATDTHAVGDKSEGLTVKTERRPVTIAVAISGTARYGEQLTANVIDKEPAEATISYQWNRNGTAIVGAANSTYTVAQADIGKVITVTVAGTGDFIGSTTSNAVTPTKADGPLTPAAQPVATTVSWNRAVLQETAGYEYKLSGGVWQKSPIFENLNPNREYTFYQRVAETDTHFAGQISEGLTVTTDKETIEGNLNITGTRKFGDVLTADRSNITPAGATISYQWNRNGASIDGAINSTYTVTQTDIGEVITVTVTGTGDYMGIITSAAVIPTKADSAQAEKPVTTTVGWNRVVLEETAGYEYKMNDGVWQTSGVFEELLPNTVYIFYQRIAETDTHFAGQISEGLTVKTEGNIDITGILKYGEEIVAKVTDVLPDEAIVSYQWNRNGTAISGARNSTYTVTQADIGKDITVTATVTGAEDFKGSITSDAVTPTKADGLLAPAAKPVATEVSWNRVVLHETSGYEYKLNNGVWQQSGTFENLNPSTEYIFYQRIAETDTHFAGQISEGLTVKTVERPPFTKTADEYVKPQVVLAEGEEEIEVDLDGSVPVVIAVADKNVYTEPVRLSVSVMDTQSEEGKERAIEVERLVNELLTKAAEASGKGESALGKVDKIVMLDISLKTVSDNRIVQPQNGEVTITIPLPDGYDPEKTVIAHMKSDGTIELLDTTVKDGWITFSTSSFSNFAIIQLNAPASEALEAVRTVADTDSDDTDTTDTEPEDGTDIVSDETDVQEEEIVHDELVSTGQSKQSTALILFATITLVGALVTLKRKIINTMK